MYYVISVICILLILSLIIVLIESKRECRNFKVTHYSFKTRKLSDNFGRFKIVMIADMHNTVFDGDNESLIKVIREFMPDAVVLAGDMIVCHRDAEKPNAKTAEFINKVSEYSTVYYGIGNHEKGSMELISKVGDIWEKYYNELYRNDNDKVILMDNKSIGIRQNGSDSVIRIYGLDLNSSYYKRFIAKELTKDMIDEQLGEINPNEYNILIAHNPDYFKTYAEWGPDLIFSGHNHGGLVRLPFFGGVISPRLRLFPKYDYGLYNTGDSTMVLTNGIGAHSIKIRVSNIPELVLIEIN